METKMPIPKYISIDIKSISVAPLDVNTNFSLIYGLGDDNKIYWWDDRSGEWLLDMVEKINPNAVPID